MAKFIKSYSNYVKQTTHQTVNDGKILQRDWTTIGGIDNYSPNQNIVYKNNNFLITVDDTNYNTYDGIQESWLKNSGGTDEWVLSDVENDISNYNSENSIVLKNNIYDLKDYAYFGSCKELIRASINDILAKFPGELYITDNGLKYYDNNLSGYTYVGGVDNNGKPNYVYVSNPFNINIYDEDINVSEKSDSLKYFANNGYREYEVIKNGETSGTFINCIAIIPNQEVTISYKDNNNNSSISSKTMSYYEYLSIKDSDDSYYSGKTLTSVNLIDNNADTLSNKMLSKVILCLGEGNICNKEEQICMDISNKLELYVYMNEDCTSIYYLANKEFIGYHIRPKNKYEYDNLLKNYIDRRHLSNYFNNLDSFEKILLNPNTSPKYSALFNIYYEDEYGFNSQLKQFTFPLNEGGYNIGNSYTFLNYINTFENIGDLYDEYFSDNIYRMLTHEAIKNFDWAYSNKEESDNDNAEYIFGETKISDILRVYGREFDEIKQYIKSIKINNNISYDEIDNMPDYLLTDVLNLDGWNIKNIYPYFYKNNSYYQYDKNSIEYYPYNNIFKSPIIDKLKNNYPYSSTKKYNLADINLSFLRKLKINSKHILKSKGTINGIEMLLSLFGLKSKRWVDKRNSRLADNSVLDKDYYDYDIKEYTTFMYPILDTYKDNLQMSIYNYYNKAKLIQYNNENYYNGIYNNYQGLPVIYTSGETGNILYPYFDKNEEYDGNLYYQMNGGWMKIYPFDFDINNNIISGNNLYTETIREIKSVNNLSDLLDMPLDDLKEGEIVYVKDISNKSVIIDNKIYDINYEINQLGNISKYISVFFENNNLIIGNQTFTENVTVSNYNTTISDNKLINLNVIDLTQLSDGEEIKIYLFDDNSKDNIAIYSNNLSVTNVKFYEDYLSITHYYKLYSIDAYQEISDFGWKAIQKNDDEYKLLNRYINNYKANNPHTGHKNYDNGYEYMNYFYNLFNYPLKENLFDETAFNNDYYSMIDILSNFGFTNISTSSNTNNDDFNSPYKIENDDINNNCNTNYYELEDKKIHVFSNLALPTNYKDDKNKPSKCNINSEILHDKGLSGNTLYSSFTLSDSIDKYINSYNDNNYIKDREWLKKEIIPLNFNNNTYSVVNTKRIDINFKSGVFDNLNFTKNTKYLLDIINNYIQQIIPSNAICHLNFN